jgi:hypothetical protein
MRTVANLQIESMHRQVLAGQRYSPLETAGYDICLPLFWRFIAVGTGPITRPALADNVPDS